MDNISFGKYTPNNTFIHKLDSRNKLFLTLFMTVIIFLKFNDWPFTLLMSGIYLVLLLTLMIISKVKLGSLLKALSGMWMMFLFIFIIYIFIPNASLESPVAFSIGKLDVKLFAIYQAIYILLRIFIMLSLMMILTSTTTPMELTGAFEWYGTPLKKIKFPVNEISMTLSIAIRFIPTLIEETSRIIKAQESRGVDFSKGGLAKKTKMIASLIVPLFVSAINRSEELSDAMEVRGYDPKAERTKYKRLTFSWRDLLAFVLVIAFGTLIIVLRVKDKTVPISLM